MNAYYSAPNVREFSVEKYMPAEMQITLQHSA